ncbi:hypothetical protein ABGB18_06755 [Nonomuraea sp. B12E4]|uniref:hypothetical protein n=1 Tax=Nonomuraea sp. B12E4 TaxID=3153564 RepID=UPI00325D9C1F
MTSDDLAGRADLVGRNNDSCPLPHERAACDIDGFYLWDLHSGHGDGACGVTDQRHLAQSHLAQALAEHPSRGTKGSIRRVWLDRLANQPCYIYGRVLMRAHRDQATGAIVFYGDK